MIASLFETALTLEMIGPVAGDTLVVYSGDIVTIGHHERSSIRVYNEKVEEFHCQLFHENSIWIVVDLASRSGTSVNQRRIVKQQVLCTGDVLSVGPFNFRVKLRDLRPVRPFPAPKSARNFPLPALSPIAVLAALLGVLAGLWGHRTSPASPGVSSHASQNEPLITIAGEQSEATLPHFPALATPTLAPPRPPLRFARNEATLKPIEALPEKLPPLPKSVALFITSLRSGHGDWIIDDDAIKVHSWSYGLPGMMVEENEESADATLQATLRSIDTDTNGWQGFAMCLSKNRGECHGTPAIVARVFNRNVELLDCVTDFRGNRGAVLAMAPVAADMSCYDLKLIIRNGQSIAVFVNEEPALTHTLKYPLHGGWALVAANGTYSFEGIQFKSKRK